MQKGDISYPVNEIFYSLQGEGYHTGIPAIFIRLSGCNLRCDFCDTDFTASSLMTPDTIIETAKNFPAKTVIITGGEPTLYNLEPLVLALHEEHFKVHLETNGTSAPCPGIDWITCSPKLHHKNGIIGYHVDERMFTMTDELKIVYQDDDIFEQVASMFATSNKFLQPCSCSNTAQTVAYILAHPRWRLSLQTHKLIDIQ